MPTGYTHQLERLNYDTKKWIRESVVRGMGVTITLRDNGPMTSEEILKALEDDITKEEYYSKKKPESEHLLQAFVKMTKDERRELFKTEVQKATEDFQKRSKEEEEKKSKHVKCMQEVNKLKLRAEREESEALSTLEFAAEQLSSAFDFDYGHPPYRDEVMDLTFEAWEEKKEARLRHDCYFYMNEQMKDRKRKQERLDYYKTILKFLEQT